MCPLYLATSSLVNFSSIFYIIIGGVAGLFVYLVSRILGKKEKK
jgi:hypothetical protein